MTPVIITGDQGQDGYYLKRSFSELKTEVIGISRIGPVNLINGNDVTELVRSTQPRAVYHLAAHHHSSEEAASSDQEIYRALHVDALRFILEAVREHSPSTRVFYAASSHVFGNPENPVQNEMTPARPNSAYAQSKSDGWNLCKEYRAQFGVFASVGILYNHESSRRPERFLSQKIIRAAVAASADPKAPSTPIGAFSAQADWGYAPDYVEAMIRIMDLPDPDDFVIATGKPHSVEEFAKIAFDLVELDFRDYLHEDPTLLKRQTSQPLIGDASKLFQKTGWTPKTDFKTMIQLLMKEAGAPC